MGCAGNNDVCTSEEDLCVHPAVEAVMQRNGDRKVTHEEAEMEELLKKKASARRKNQRLTQEESLLQTYLNMVQINPVILEWRVAEKRRKDFGVA